MRSRGRWVAGAAAVAVAGAAVAVPLGGPRPPKVVIPRAEGPLRLSVVFPDSGAAAPVPYGYVIGSVGNGRATLSINGTPVEVMPNGAFLAYLPTPAGPAPAYRVLAELDGRTESRVVPLTGWAEGLRRDSAAVDPRAPLRVRPGEAVPVIVRAPADARVSVKGGGAPVPLAFDGHAWSAAVPQSLLDGRASVEVRRGDETVRLPLPAAEATAAPSWAVLGDPRGRVRPEGIAVRSAPGGTYRWLLLPGTRVEVTGRRGGDLRVRLDEGLDGWVADSLAKTAAAGEREPARAGRVAVEPGTGWTDVAVPLPEPLPFSVREEAGTVTLIVFHARPGTEPAAVGAREDWVRNVRSDAVGAGSARYTVYLGGPVFGWQVRWQGGRMVLRLRHAPAVDASAPLRGRTVAIDAGHPPRGATGPNGTHEDGLTLAVARRVAALLRERGARVVLTRADAAPVELDDRVARAAAGGAEALVSIHLDATAERADPRESSGTATHFYHPHSLGLARAVQAAVVRRMGLADRGVSPANLAMVRPTWFPAVLCEGASLVLPAEEAAMRTPEFQEAYARGIADGLQAFFASLAAGADPLDDSTPQSP
jgi:N-acetylmuramoyl-L-alanine amidase